MAARPLPDGQTSVTRYLAVDDATVQVVAFRMSVAGRDPRRGPDARRDRGAWAESCRRHGMRMATATKRLFFGPELFSFLEDLRANNEREWFAANKHRYEEHLV
jgi:hypothetical protein